VGEGDTDRLELGGEAQLAQLLVDAMHGALFEGSLKSEFQVKP